jgi:hypothetical protein
MPSFSSQSAICCIAAPYAFSAIRSGPTGQEVYHARRLIAAPAVGLHVRSGSTRDSCTAANRVFAVATRVTSPPPHRVAGGGRPPPAPTQRGVRISRTGSESSACLIGPHSPWSLPTSSKKTRNDYIRHVKTFTAFLGVLPDTAIPEDRHRFQLHQKHLCR